MAKDPAFLFYSSDFLAGIQDLTMEERGQYITLLCLQHQKGHLSDKIIKLAVAYPAADVMAKFRQDPNTKLWYNKRLDAEIEKRKESGEKQRKRALDGWEKRKKEKETHATANATALPLEDVNENIDEIIIEDIERTKICLKILTDFGFNEISSQDKQRKISESINFIIHSGRFEYFKEQYNSYFEYKKISGENKHSLKTFFDWDNKFSQPGWDAKNWTDQIKQYGKPTNNPDTRKRDRDALGQAAAAISSRIKDKHGFRNSA